MYDLSLTQIQVMRIESQPLVNQNAVSSLGPTQGKVIHLNQRSPTLVLKTCCPADFRYISALIQSKPKWLSYFFSMLSIWQRPGNEPFIWFSCVGAEAHVKTCRAVDLKDQHGDSWFKLIFKSFYTIFLFIFFHFNFLANSVELHYGLGPDYFFWATSQWGTI